jgi:surface antigen
MKRCLVAVVFLMLTAFAPHSALAAEAPLPPGPVNPTGRTPDTLTVVGTTITPLFSSVPQTGNPDAFPPGQCTYYAAWQHRVTWGGNAADWYDNARAHGVSVTRVPSVGAIAVWLAGPRYGVYGHVGIVIRVMRNSYTFAEMNYVGNGIIDQRVVAWPDPDIEGFIP